MHHKGEAAEEKEEEGAIGGHDEGGTRKIPKRPPIEQCGALVGDTRGF